MKNSCYKKTLVFGILVLLIGSGCIPGISGKLNSMTIAETIIDSSLTALESTPLTFYTFDKTGVKQCKAELPLEDTNKIYETLEKLKISIEKNPYSDITQSLKNYFVDLLDVNGLTSGGIKKADVHSLLNPSVDIFKEESYRVGAIGNLLLNLFSNIEPRGMGRAFFCSVGSGGSGFMFPVTMLLPRPRAFVVWFASDSVTSVSQIIGNKGFIAFSKQNGLAVGFTGVGLTYSVAGETFYGFIGNALFATVFAESFKYFPENFPPTISVVSPLDGAVDVPLSTSELRFRIEDPNGDLMRYTVTTDPDIGDGVGIAKPDGEYSIPISGLKDSTEYTWTVELTDGLNEVVEQFNFFTEMLPFDPFDEGWQYRKKITIDHDQVAGDLVDFPVLISTIDSDLRDKAQDDGDDILLMDGTGVANKLFHEIEYFDGSSGELVVWVRIPDLSSSIDTVLYMCYGNPDCNSQQNVHGTWDSNYVGVWHMNDMTTSTIEDSTSNNIIGTKKDINEPVEATGKIVICQDFDGSGGGDDDHINAGHPVCLYNTDYITVEMLIYVDNLPPFGHGDILERKDKAFTLYLIDSGGLKFYYWSSGGTRYWGESSFTLSTNTWYHVAATFTSNGNQVELFKNGIKNMSTESTSSEWQDNSNDMYIGGDPGETAYTIDGKIDEFRISNIVRSDGWILTGYNNQNDPSSFFSVGPEETSP